MTDSDRVFSAIGWAVVVAGIVATVLVIAGTFDDAAGGPIVPWGGREDSAAARPATEVGPARTQLPAVVDAVVVRVFGPDGAPVPGAEVVLLRAMTAWPEERVALLESARTDRDGQAVMRTRRGPDLLVEAVGDGLARGRVRVDRDLDSVTVRLEHGFGLAGYVLDPAGQAVPDCAVVLEPGSFSRRRAVPVRTDSRGRFEFRHQTAGVARVTARHELYDPVTLPAVTIGPAAEWHRLQFRVGRPPVPGQVVRNGSREPIANAEIRVYPTVGWNAGLFEPFVARSDAEGRFELRGVGTGNVRIDVSHPELSTERRTVALGRSREALVFEMIGRTRLVGRLRGAAAGIELRLTTAMGELGRAAVAADGSFAFPDTYSVGDATLEIVDGAAAFRSTAEREREIVLEDVPSNELEFEAVPANRLTGVVTGESGQPLAGVHVSILHRLRIGPERLLAVTGADGRYTLAGLSPGSFELLFERDGYARVQRSETMEAGEDREVEIVELVRPGTVRGTVTRGGAPLAGAFVFVGSGRWHDPIAVTGPDGSYTLQDVEPGEHRIKARYSTLPIELAGQAVAVRSGEVVLAPEIGFRPGRTIRGVVVDPRGEGVAGAPVMIAERSSAVLVTDSAGAFELEVPFGEVVLLAYSRDFELDTKTTIRRDQADARLELPLIESVPLTARVLGLPSRRPVTVGLVRIEPLDDLSGLDEVARRQRAVAAMWVEMPSGRLRIAHFPRGRSRLTLHCPGFAPVVRDVVGRDGGGVDLGTLLLEPGARVRGVVVNEAGRPVPNAAVHLGDELDLFRQGADPPLRTDGDGRFELSGVTPDATTVVVAAPGHAVRTHALRLPDDLLRTEPLRIELRRAAHIDVELTGSADDLGGVRVALYRGPILLDLAVTDRDGRARFAAPAAGTYRVAWFGTAVEQEVVVGDGSREYTVRLRAH